TGLLSVAVSLAIRVVERGPYVSGWALVAPTQGHLLASTRPVWGAVSEAFYQNRHFWLPFSVYSVPYSLIPGYLGRLWPWEYWVHVLVFVTFASTLWTILRAADLPLRDGGILLLGWGASPILLSHSVEGYPWASAFLPQQQSPWPALQPGVATMPAGVAALARAIGTLELDLPILFGVGVASFFFLRRDRRLLVALFLVQLGLVVLLATYQADQLR